VKVPNGGVLDKTGSQMEGVKSGELGTRCWLSCLLGRIRGGLEAHGSNADP
jgi:hypothetical protein